MSLVTVNHHVQVVCFDDFGSLWDFPQVAPNIRLWRAVGSVIRKEFRVLFVEVVNPPTTPIEAENVAFEAILPMPARVAYNGRTLRQNHVVCPGGSGEKL